jgi:hypothetical protein
MIEELITRCRPPDAEGVIADKDRFADRFGHQFGGSAMKTGEHAQSDSMGAEG